MIKTLLVKIFRVFLLISCKLITGIQARWLSEPNNRLRIFYANHTSHLDGLVLWSCFPKHLRSTIHPVAAKDYWAKTKFKRFIAKDVFNSVLINRKPTQQDNPITALEEMLQHKQSLILFPEGTRGNGEHIADFKGGLFYLAKHFPDVELVPVYLNNLNRVLPKGSKLLVPIICSATFGRPLPPLKEIETKDSFSRRAKQALEELAP
ncbi:1-acyl-sn-glycerol-3-phosphate acyltransferase [Orbus hercynius]|uniref:1-acyl-sn-glycerol-3-phosphate acyltransferase n=1 Tax=Orbus hercynius TaxID=593135 RepID=A0A495RAV5_9GAMM|nr:lysophospholipid acyltransferase family protein [Orbus hercynius]RKS84617.1 1-acyl-sn-glycerol-3-phosphate acyltransferase [Orbus hercynius]